MMRYGLLILVTTLAAWGLPGSAAAQADNEISGARALQEKAAASGTVRVIVRLAPQAAPAGQRLMGKGIVAAQSQVQRSMSDIGVSYVKSIADLPLTVLEVNDEQLTELLASGLVEAIEEDVIEHTYLAQSVPLIDAPGAWSQGARGAGQAVAILDTGVDRNHPFLGGRVVAEACFSSTSASQGSTTLCPNGQQSQTGSGAGVHCTINGCTHGAHVAGIAAGSGTSSSGVAPDASIIAIQVFSRFDDQPGGPTPCRDGGTSSPCVLTFRSDQISALQHVLTLSSQFTIASVNMSLGGGESPARAIRTFARGRLINCVMPVSRR